MKHKNRSAEPVSRQLVYGLSEIKKAANLLHGLLPNYKIFTFEGPLGAGKTALIKEFLKMLSVKEIVKSPTYTYLNVYHTEDNQKIYHFDLYRLETLESFFEMGFEEYLHIEDGIVVIEWPEIIKPILTQGVVHVQIEYEGTEKRRLTYVCK